jgi:hypothetical protein
MHNLDSILVDVFGIGFLYCAKSCDLLSCVPPCFILFLTCVYNGPTVPKPVCNATVQTNCTCHTLMKDGICETSHSGSSLSLWSLIGGMGLLNSLIPHTSILLWIKSSSYCCCHVQFTYVLSACVACAQVDYL